MTRNPIGLQEVQCDAELPLAPALVLPEAPSRPAAPRGDGGQLVYERHDSSTLFSASMLQDLALSSWRPPAAPERRDDVSETFVPIAASTHAWGRDPWLWGSLTLATMTLLFFFCVALDLLVRGG